MEIVLKESYYVFLNDSIVRFYDMDKKAFVLALRITEPWKAELLYQMNFGKETAKLTEEEKNFQEMILKEPFSQFFEEVSIEKANLIRRKSSLVRQFCVECGEAIDLQGDPLCCMVKEALFRTEVILWGSSLCKKSHWAYQCMEYGDDSYPDIREDALYVIDRGTVSAKLIRQFETMAVQKNLIRLYVYEDTTQIVIGPGLRGEDAGCLFCHWNPESFPVEAAVQEHSELFTALVNTEILKTTPVILPVLLKDITLAKGKTFTMHKFNLAAEEEEWSPELSCTVCGR